MYILAENITEESVYEREREREREREIQKNEFLTSWIIYTYICNI